MQKRKKNKFLFRDEIANMSLNRKSRLFYRKASGWGVICDRTPSVAAPQRTVTAYTANISTKIQGRSTLTLTTLCAHGFTRRANNAC